MYILMGTLLLNTLSIMKALQRKCSSMSVRVLIAFRHIWYLHDPKFRAEFLHQVHILKDLFTKVFISTHKFFCYVHIYCEMITTIKLINTYINSLPDEPLFHSPIPLLQVIAEHQAELPVLHSSFPLAIYFMYGKVCVSILLSQFVPPTRCPAPFRGLLSMSASLVLPANRFISNIFLDSIYMH